MADNSTLPATGDIIAADDIGGGVKVQRMKVGFGVDGAYADASSASGLPIGGSQAALSSTAWTSATGVNTANSISVVGYNTVTVALANTSTMTAGVLTFEVSPDGGSNWFPIAMARIDASYKVDTTYTLNVVANVAWSTSVDGFTNFRVRLSTAITGTGTANVFVTAQAMPIEPIVTVGQADPALMNATLSQRQVWFETDVPGVANAAYAAGDQFGTLITIPNAVRVAGGTGWISGIVYHDNDDVMGAIDIFFFNDTVTLAADNAVFALSDADARKIVYVASMTFMLDNGANRFGQLTGISVPYFCTGTSLFAAVVTRTTPTPVGGATGQRIRFSLNRD